MSGLGLSMIDAPNNCHGQVPAFVDLVEDVGELLAAPVWKGEEVGWSAHILPFACSFFEEAHRAASNMDSVIVGSGSSSCAA